VGVAVAGSFLATSGKRSSLTASPGEMARQLAGKIKSVGLSPSNPIDNLQTILRDLLDYGNTMNAAIIIVLICRRG